MHESLCTVSFVFIPLQADPFAHLNLADYACQELQVSFAVANTAGLSNFSSPIVVNVPGGQYLA